MKTVLTALFLLAGIQGNAAEITQACQPGGGFFSAFPGSYTVQMKIGTQVFDDQMTISSITRRPGMLNASEAFQGTFTVTNVFSAKILDGNLNVFTTEKNSMTFNILAEEHGTTFPVYFKAQGLMKEQACRLEGTAYSPTPSQKMGTFTIFKNTSDCICTL